MICLLQTLQRRLICFSLALCYSNFLFGGKASAEYFYTAQLNTNSYGYAFGVLQEFYTSDASIFNKSSSLSISSIGTIGVGLQYMLGVCFEPLYKAYPRSIKLSMWISLVVSAGCFLVSSWATEVWHLIILQGVIFGFSSAALYFPVIVWLSEWFFHRRATATGIIFGGSSAGGVVFPFLFRFLLDGVGYANAMRIWATVFLVIGTVSLTLVKPRIKITAVQNEQHPRKLQIPNFGFVWTTQFALFASTVLAQRLAYTPITVLISSYSKNFAGVTALKSTLALVILNFSGMIGYLVTGYTSDRVQYWKVMIATGTAAALAAALVLGFAQNIGTIYGFVVCYGIAAGGYAAVWTAVAKGMNEESSLTIFLTMSVLGGIGTVIGPLIAGALESDTTQHTVYGTHGFRKVVIYIASLLAYVAVMGVIMGARDSRKFNGMATIRRWISH